MKHSQERWSKMKKNQMEIGIKKRIDNTKMMISQANVVVYFQIIISSLILQIDMKNYFYVEELANHLQKQHYKYSILLQSSISLLILSFMLIVIVRNTKV